jgi:hypothetical protein
MYIRIAYQCIPGRDDAVRRRRSRRWQHTRASRRRRRSAAAAAASSACPPSSCAVCVDVVVLCLLVTCTCVCAYTSPLPLPFTRALPSRGPVPNKKGSSALASLFGRWLPRASSCGRSMHLRPNAYSARPPKTNNGATGKKWRRQKNFSTPMRRLTVQSGRRVCSCVPIVSCRGGALASEDISGGGLHETESLYTQQGEEEGKGGRGQVKLWGTRPLPSPQTKLVLISGLS